MGLEEKKIIAANFAITASDGTMLKGWHCQGGYKRIKEARGMLNKQRLFGGLRAGKCVYLSKNILIVCRLFCNNMPIIMFFYLHKK